jgi:autotransporter-associated beta strand protein
LNLGNSGIVMYANSNTVNVGGIGLGSQGATIAADQAWENNSSSLLTVNALSVDNGSSANPVLTLSGAGSGGYSFGRIDASAVTAPQVAGVLSLRFNRTGTGPITFTSANTLLKGFQIGDGTTATVPTTLTTGTGNNRPVVGDGGIVMNANSGAFNFGSTASQGVTIVANQTWQNNSGSLLTVSSFAVDNASAANPVLTLSGSGTGGYSLGKIENSNGGTGVPALIVNMNGVGVVELTGNSTFTGGTTLTAGTLLLTHNSALGTGIFTINGGTITSSASARSTANPQVWGGDWTFGGANNWATGVSTVNLSGNRTVTVSGTGIPNVDSVISGNGDITKAGSGTLILSNSNSYVGKTIVSEGTLNLDFGNNSVGTSSGEQSNKIPTTSPLELGGGTLTVTGGLSRTAWSVVSDTPWASATLISSTATTSRYDLTFATLPAVSVGQPVTSILAGFTGFVQGVSAATLTVTIDVPLATPALPATGTDFATSVITSPWSAMSTIGLPSGQYQLTFASSIAVTPGQPVTATGLTGAYVVRTSGTTLIVASSTAPAATGTDFAVGAFAPNSSQTFASTSLVTGVSTITAALNGGNGVKVDLAAITRAVGSTVQLNLPTGTLSATNGILTSTGTTSTTLLDSGVAYASAGANNWAAKDATNTFIESASIDLNVVALLGAPNSSTATGVDTVLAADSSPVTMRSNLDEVRTITASGFTITTGGVLVGSGVTAANGLTIAGGTLKSAATAANKDLVVINNGAGSLMINSTIANSTAGATGLTKSGTGTVSLGGTNSYTGSTVINMGTLSLTTNISLANSSGIVIGKDATAILNLNFVGTEYVASLTINGVAQPDGVYTSSDPSGRITGGGTLTVGGAPPATPYDTWAATFAPADVSNPAGDNDGDGLVNQEEFAFGLNPLSGSSVNPILVQLDKTNGQFSYQRRADTGLTYTILKSTTLAAGSWSSASANQASGAVDGNGNQTVVVTLPGAPLTDAKLFLRVSAE